MNEMIERVARAMDPVCFIDLVADIEGFQYRKLVALQNARVAIEAMREPTDEMVKAAFVTLELLEGSQDDCWKSMIDAALTEATNAA